MPTSPSMPSAASSMIALSISFGILYYPLHTLLAVCGYLIQTSCSVWYPVVHQANVAYHSFKGLVDPDETRGHLSVLFQLASMIGQLAWSRLRSSRFSTPETTRFNARYVRIPFQYRDRSYFYLLKVPRGVIPIQSIVNQDQVDVREEIEPYLGPNLDCLGAVISPADFGHQRLVFTTAMDRVITVEENEPIQLTVS